MRIGIVTTWFERGAAMVSRAYRDLFLQQGHEVFIYARAGEAYAKGAPNWDGPNVTWGRRVAGCRGTRVHWRQFRRWTLSNKLDVLLFNEQTDWPAIIFSRRELPCLIAAYVDYYTELTVPWFRLYDVLICNTKRHASAFPDHPKVLYIPWGTDLNLFMGPAKERRDGAPFTFFHSAGMSPHRKGTLCAMEAFHGLSGDARFLLHMQAPLKGYPEIAKLVEMDKRIEVVNETVPAPGLYHRGDVYVYPTLLEGIGLTIMEAIACGLPAVVPDTGPMNEFVIEGESGSVVAPYEYRGRSDGYYWATCHCKPEAVREAMQRYLDMSSAQLWDSKLKARAFAESALDWSKNALELPGALLSVFEKGVNRERYEGLEKEILDKALAYSITGRLWRQLRLRLPFQSNRIDALTYG